MTTARSKSLTWLPLYLCLNLFICTAPAQFGPIHLGNKKDAQNTGAAATQTPDQAKAALDDFLSPKAGQGNLGGINYTKAPDPDHPDKLKATVSWTDETGVAMPLEYLGYTKADGQKPAVLYFSGESKGITTKVRTEAQVSYAPQQPQQASHSPWQKLKDLSGGAAAAGALGGRGGAGVATAAGHASDAATDAGKVQSGVDTVNGVKHIRDTRTGQFAVRLDEFAWDKQPPVPAGLSLDNLAIPAAPSSK